MRQSMRQNMRQNKCSSGLSSLAVRLVIVILLVFGVWQVGHAAYMLAKAKMAQYLLSQAWNEMQAGAVARKPWPWADTFPLVKLQFADDEAMIVLAGASGRNLAFAPAHVSASVKPGVRGVSVIGGHRDTHFASLEDAKVQDLLTVEYPGGERLFYQVTQVSVVDSRSSTIALDAEQSMLALVACYPFDSFDAGGPLRFVVIAEIVSAPGLRVSDKFIL